MEPHGAKQLDTTAQPKQGMIPEGREATSTQQVVIVARKVHFVP